MSTELKPGIVYVCPERDIECGNRADMWCATCPKSRTAPVSAPMGQELPPPTYMTADQAFEWAWSTLKKDLNAERWKVGEEVQSWAFYKYGWDHRAQFERQVESAYAERIRQLERELAERRPRVALDPELKAALDEAAKTRAAGAILPDGSVVFINYGDQPEDTADLCCTACGGSGHIDDQRDIASRAERKTASIDSPEFRELIDALLREYWSPEPHVDALIAYIDGRTAGAAGGRA